MVRDLEKRLVSSLPPLFPDYTPSPPNARDLSLNSAIYFLFRLFDTFLTSAPFLHPKISICLCDGFPPCSIHFQSHDIFCFFHKFTTMTHPSSHISFNKHYLYPRPCIFFPKLKSLCTNPRKHPKLPISNQVARVTTTVTASFEKREFVELLRLFQGQKLHLPSFEAHVVSFLPPCLDALSGYDTALTHCILSLLGFEI